MILTLFRCLFVVVVVSIGMGYVEVTYEQYSPLLVLAILVGGSILVIGIDALTPRKSLLQLSGLFFGLVLEIGGSWAR